MRILVLLLAVALLAPASAAARPRLGPPDAAHIGARPVVVHDRVLRTQRGQARAAAAPGYGGRFRTAGGESLRVYESRTYTPDPAVLQSWADFFAGLIHGSELARLTVFLAPYKEMVQLCTAEADSCFDPAGDRIVLVGETPPDGTNVEEIAAHEFGHHIALNRSNRPWSAIERGPKYWASYMNVCALTNANRIFPGDEGRHYALNPGEGWAETNRVLNGGRVPWNRVSNLFKPDAAALRWATRDILEPWTATARTVYDGRFSRLSQHRRSAMLDTFADGRMDLALRPQRGLDVDLAIYDTGSGRRLARSRLSGSHTDRIAFTICGQEGIRAEVVRRRGLGSWSLTVSAP